jgi:hypothetical protein
MGFGINDLRVLYDTLIEISKEKIIKEVFEDLKSYEKVIGSRNKRESIIYIKK